MRQEPAPAEAQHTPQHVTSKKAPDIAPEPSKRFWIQLAPWNVHEVERSQSASQERKP
jgi:hypothetical protein